MAQGPGARGFSLVELLVATLLLLVVMTSLVAVLLPAHGAFRAQPEVSDLQQRLRTIVDVLHADLMAAGAGFTSGPAPGPLVRRFPPVLPYRLGTVRSDPASGTFYRPDAITVVTLNSNAAQCSTAAQADALGLLRVAAGPGCPAGDPVCGFEPGARALIADIRGAWDLFTVTAVFPASSQVEHGQDGFSDGYAAGADVATVQVRTYYWRSDGPEPPALMRYDGYRSDLPVVDNVVGVRFEYFGDPEPPRLITPASPSGGPLATYGPGPPPVGVDEERDAWPPGENCVFAVQESAHVPRLPVLSADAGALPRLDPALFVDGPWCPDAAFPNRFDADLLRIRRVRVTVRVQAGSLALRGPAGPWFARPGLAIDAHALVPDRELSLDVAPRGLQLWR